MRVFHFLVQGGEKKKNPHPQPQSVAMKPKHISPQRPRGPPSSRHTGHLSAHAPGVLQSMGTPESACWPHARPQHKANAELKLEE